MAGPATILREIHRLRRYLKELDERTASAPRQLKAQQAKLASAEDVFKTAQETLKKLKLTIHEKELAIKTTQAMVHKYEKQKDQIMSAKEFEALNHEIAQGRGNIGKLEDEVLEMLNEAEERTAAMPGNEAVVKKAREDFAQWEKDQKDRLEKFGTERAKAAEDLKAAEATLPADLKPVVDRLIAAHGVDALSGVQGNICAACYTELTAQTRSELRQDLFVTCKSCGRMLYPE